MENGIFKYVYKLVKIKGHKTYQMFIEHISFLFDRIIKKLILVRTAAAKR